MSCECCSNAKTTLRDDEYKKRLTNRLSRIEGQVRGLRKMVEDDVYCTDILTQASAISAALDGFSRELLGEHIKGCVTNGIRQGDTEIVDELLDILRKMM